MNRDIYALRLLRMVLSFALVGAASVGAQVRETGPSTEQDPRKISLLSGHDGPAEGASGGAHRGFESLFAWFNKPEAHNSFGWVLLHQGQVDPAIVQFHWL
jgi:hypothetical protein